MYGVLVYSQPQVLKPSLGIRSQCLFSKAKSDHVCVDKLTALKYCTQETGIYNARVGKCYTDTIITIQKIAKFCLTAMKWSQELRQNTWSDGRLVA